MVEPTDLALVVSNEPPATHIQIMESNVRRGEDQGERQYQSYQTVISAIMMECFVQH